MPRRRTHKAPVNERLIGERLREIRKRRELTQDELANKLGINQTLVSQYERGKLRMHGTLIAAFAKALKVSSDELLGLQRIRGNGFIQDRRLLRRLEKMDSLSRSQKRALLATIDAFISAAER
ncbi:MAG TPA: helix-turn-helix transcriptional regulator [Vicinamibacteria bacterium]